MNENLVNILAVFLMAITIFFVIRVIVRKVKKTINFFKKKKERINEKLNYENSSYYKITKLPLYVVENNLGYYGEYLTYKNLKSFEEKGAKFLFNLYLPTEDNKTTEIDVLMICSKGVFVFESKNFSGWIFGDESKSGWYQTLPMGYGNIDKEEFYNPIMQNRKHIEHLKSVLNSSILLWSIVVFSDRCELKNINLVSNEVAVIHRSDVYKVVTSICEKNNDELLNENEINNIYNQLYEYSQVDSKTKIEHNFGLKINSSTESPIDIVPVSDKSKEDTICPKCGGKLVLRTAKRGDNTGNQFYGCSNYPKCRYTRNI